jgi:microcystin-dependent protein
MPKFTNTLKNAELTSDPTAVEGTFYYNSFTDELKIKGASAWAVLGGSTTTEMPTGSVIAWTGSPSAPPSGWLLCNGAAVSRTTYSSLYAITSTYFGVGNGTTTFNLPDFSGLSLVGAILANEGVAVGNTAGGRVWTYGSADPFTTLTHSSDNAAHTHTFSDTSAGAHTHTISHSTSATNTDETAAGGHTHTFVATPSTNGHSHTTASTGAGSGGIALATTTPIITAPASSHTHTVPDISGGDSHGHTVTESCTTSGSSAHGFASPTVPSYTGTSGSVSSHSHGGSMGADGTAAHTHNNHSANRARVWYLVKS